MLPLFFYLEVDNRQASYPAGPGAEALHFSPETNTLGTLLKLVHIGKHKQLLLASLSATYQTRSPSLYPSDIVHGCSL